MTKINVNEITTVTEVKEAILNKAFSVEYMARPVKMKADAVIDEEKSVKWNREEVERINNEASEAYAAYRKSIREAENVERETVIRVFATEYGMSQEKVERVFLKAWDDSHSCGMFEVVQTLEELMDLIVTVNSID